MLFNSFVFVLVFLPLTVIVFFAAGRFSRKAAAAFLAAASLIFYSYWDPRYLILLLVSVAINYTAGRAISRARDRSLAWWFAAAGIGANLAILGYCKYADFFITSLNIAGALSIPILRVVLPIGISFCDVGGRRPVAGRLRFYRGLDNNSAKAQHITLMDERAHMAPLRQGGNHEDNLSPRA